MSTVIMSTGFVLLNSKGKQIEDLIDVDFDTDICNQPYDYSSPVKDDECRPGFFTPPPVSPKKPIFGFQGPFKLRRETNWKCLSTLGKRKFHEAFDSEDDERYGQHISADFFKNNVGHSVRPTPDKWEDQSWDEYIRQEGKRERDSESKYDPEEIMHWCYTYLANKKKND